MKVIIIESSYPKDFFSEQLDGQITNHLTKILQIESRLIYALDKCHLSKSIKLAAQQAYNVVHLSCHGNDDGISVTDNAEIRWAEFAGLFEKNEYSPEALIMSTCCGASDKLADEFEKIEHGPKIIIGSIDERYYNEYAVAWSILYNKFKKDGVHRSVARVALRHINATVHKNFRYLRWDDDRKEYVQYPGEGRRFEVVEKFKKIRK